MTLAIHPQTTTYRTKAGYRVVTDARIDIDQVEGLIRGYVFIWGSPQQVDAFSTWFDKARPPETATSDGMHVRPICYEHAQDDVVMTEIVGRIDRVWFDDVGMAYEGHLYRSSPFFARIVSELLRRELKTSSASTESALWYSDMAFYFWPLGELSLTKHPAEKRIPASVLVRSAEGKHEVSRAGEAQLSSTVRLEGSTSRMDPQLQALYDQFIAEGMTEEEALAKIQELVAAAVAAGGSPAAAPAAPPVPAVSDAPPATMMSNPAAQIQESARAFIEDRRRANEIATLRSSITQLTTQVETALTARQQDETSRRNAPPVQTPAQRGAAPAQPQITAMRDLRTAHLTESDMWFVRSLLHDNGVETSEEFNRAMAHKTFDALQADKLRLDAPFRSTLRSSFQRADDFMASNIVGQGSDWTGKFYSSEIWEKARVEVQLLSEMTSRNMRIIEVPDGSKDATVFLEGADMVWHTTQQANDKDVTGRPEVVTNVGFVGTDKVDVEPGELTAAAAYTDILDEDSMIPIANQLNSQFQLSALEVIEAAMINGDVATGASVNINLIDGTPATGLDKPYYLVSNGILKLPLVTATSLARDASGVLNENTFQATVQKLPKRVRGKKQKMLYLLDVDTYEACLVIPALKTKDVAGDDYTLRTGELRPIFGVKPIQSGLMELANSAGKVPAAGGTLGRIAAIYCPYWALVWKREISFENARFALSKTNVIVGSLRMAMRRRSDEAAALSYNVPVSISA